MQGRHNIKMKFTKCPMCGFQHIKKQHGNSLALDHVIPLMGKKSDKEIADIVGCSTTTIYFKRKSLGINPFRGHNHSDKMERAKKLFHLPDIIIAKEVGLSRERIRQIREKVGADKVKKHSCLMMTEEQGKQIIELLKERKHSFDIIAKHCGLSISIVKSFIKRYNLEKNYKTKKVRIYNDEKLLNAWNGNLEETAEKLGLCENTIRKALIRLGLKEPKKRMSPQQIRKVLKKRGRKHKYVTSKGMAETVGCHPIIIKKYLKEMGYEYVSPQKGWKLKS
jgi:hypothetical protein